MRTQKKKKRIVKKKIGSGATSTYIIKQANAEASGMHNADPRGPVLNSYLAA